MEIGLVSCSKGKLDESAPPKELYMESSYFRKMREYSETYHDDWYILSAKHHLLEPDGTPIEPYEQSLTEAYVDERREWARETASQIRKQGVLSDADVLVIHAGKKYYEELIPLLEDDVSKYQPRG
jgi:hypothetical protein